MNLPNKITMFRLLLIPVFVVLFALPGYNSWAVLVFVIASASDAVDGHIARKYHLITNFGKFMDPLVDKVLTCAGFVLLVGIGRMPAWVCVVVLARELVVTGLRTLAVEQGVVIAASIWGKAKTTIQMVCLIYLLLDFTRGAVLWGIDIDLTLCLLIAAITLWSGIDYLWKSRSILRDVD